MTRSSWTWACLACNVTGVGDPSAHRCVDAATWRRDFWIQRLRWAMRTSTIEQIAAVIARPVARQPLVEMLGERWAKERDAA
jgi:hypothetical protein